MILCFLGKVKIIPKNASKAQLRFNASDWILISFSEFESLNFLKTRKETVWSRPRNVSMTRVRWVTARMMLPLPQWIQCGSENSEIAGYVAQSVARWKPYEFCPFAADERSKEPSSAQHCTDCHIRHGACACVPQIAMRILLVCICVAWSGFLTLLSRVLGKSI